jgi:hypothetical protein
MERRAAMEFFLALPVLFVIAGVLDFVKLGFVELDAVCILRHRVICAAQQR